jgi:hypothetical protein
VRRRRTDEALHTCPRRADTGRVPRLPILLVSALVAGAAAAGEVYRWTDPQGEVHYTSDLERVPEAQRDAAKASVGRKQGGAVMRIETRRPPEPVPAAETEPAPELPSEPAPSYGGRDEATWRAESKRLRDAVETLEAEAEACGAGEFRWSAGGGGRDEDADAADACGRVRSELDMNRRWLEDLEEDAHRAGAPPGWLRD